jgi:hypothetical protein
LAAALLTLAAAVVILLRPAPSAKEAGTPGGGPDRTPDSTQIAAAPSDILKERLRAANPSYNLQGRIYDVAGNIVEVDIPSCGVADISPLKGFPIEKLNISGNSVSDISALKGMPLKHLNMEDCKVSDLSPIEGAPLTTLYLSGCDGITDFSFVEKCVTLRGLSLPSTVKDFSFLKRMPSLALVGWKKSERVSPEAFIESVSGAPSSETAAAPAVKETPAAAAPAEREKRREDIVKELKAANPDYGEDGSCVKLPEGWRIRLRSAKVTDLTALKGLPLISLDITNTPVKDISPLKGSPVRELKLGGCKNLTDISPLMDCGALETLVLPPEPVNLDILRKHPKLKNIGYTDPPKSASDFWRDPGRR